MKGFQGKKSQKPFPSERGAGSITFPSRKRNRKGATTLTKRVGVFLLSPFEAGRAGEERVCQQWVGCRRGTKPKTACLMFAFTRKKRRKYLISKGRKRERERESLPLHEEGGTREFVEKKNAQFYARRRRKK